MNLARPVALAAFAFAPLAAAAQNAPSAEAAPLPLTEEVRSPSIEALQATLYDLIALRHSAHQEHWNVVGIEFYQLHEFYAELYTDLAPYIDMVAERQRALGSPSDGRPGAVAENALPTAPSVAERDAETTLAQLQADWGTVSNAMYDRIEATGDDLVTQDLLIAVTSLIDKQLWKIRAHLGGSAE